MAETLKIGRKISRVREIIGMKQEALATLLGVSQQAISKIEQSEKVEDEMVMLLSWGAYKLSLCGFIPKGIIDVPSREPFYTHR